MKKKRIFLTFAFILFVALPYATTQQPPPPAHESVIPAVTVLTLDGTVNPISARYLVEGLRRAEREGAPAVVVAMDTPGGLASSMDRIVEAMLASPVPVIAYVYPPGARAASAGVFIAMAAPVIAMAPGTNIGAAHPVSARGADIPGAEGEKILNDAAARIRSLARLYGHNADWAESAVRTSVSLSADEAVRDRVADLSAGSVEELLKAVNGRRVEAAGGAVTLRTAGLAVREAPMGVIDRFLDLLVDPNLAYILFLIGIFGILIELTTPGFGLPGITGGLALLLAALAFGLLPTNLTGVLVMALAAVLFVVDVKAPTHGILTAGAIVALLLGSFLLFPPWRAPSLPGWPAVRVSPVTIVSMTALMSGLFVLIVGLGVRAQARRITVGKETLAGAAGTALTDLAPEGLVRVGGEEWTAFTAGEPIRRGEEVEVLAVQGLRLEVLRRGWPAAPPAAPPTGREPPIGRGL